MLEFAHPWLFILIPSPIIAYYALPPFWQKVSSIRIPFFDELTKAADVESRSGSVIVQQSQSARIALSTIWVLGVVALAAPQRVEEPITRTESSRDIMLSIDLSGSMETVDFPDEGGKNVSRINAVRRVVSNFVSNRDGDRVGIIVFGSKAYIQLPFTQDLETAQNLVSLMEVPMAGPKTALGDSIGLAIKAFESSEVKEKVLILLTDGNDTASKMSPLNAAGVAKTHGVRIFTIAVGDPNASGEERVDYDSLKSIAETTDGQFFTADDEEALNAIYENIDTIAPRETKTETWRPRSSISHWPIGLSILIGFGMLAVAESKRLRRSSRK